MERIRIDKFEAKSLIFKLASFKDRIDLKELNLSEHLINQIRAEFLNSTLIDMIKHKINNEGQILIDFKDGIQDLDFIDLKKILLLFISLFLKPIGVFGNQGLAREIGVNINKDINSSTGIGYIPLHTDFNNVSKPPVFSILYCHRIDPFKGGESIVSNFINSIEELSVKEKSVLLKPIYYEGDFYNLFNVGKKLNEFPIIDLKTNIIRYSSKLKSKEKTEAVLWNLRKALIRNQKTFMLNKGEILILNQKIFVHGRHSLNGNQNKLTEDNSRLLIQYFAK